VAQRPPAHDGEDGAARRDGEGAAARAASGLEAQIAERRGKRQALADAGVDPYPARFERTASLGELRAAHQALEPDTRTGVLAKVAGRVVGVRGHGKLVFLTLRDASGSLQLMAQAGRIGAAGAAVVEQIDLGDWIGAEGEVVASRRGELSLDLDTAVVLAKALRPLPDKWHGLSEQETRYRQREVDLLANDDSRRVFEVRFATVATMRRLLAEDGFVEVETPILQPQAGGALARPFVTRANALGTDLTLRIAPELYLKRLVVGGMERVFEIARNFRNEGIDTRHSPEFTALEAYQAFGDVDDGMALTERLVVAAAQAATGRLAFAVGETTVDLTPPWPRASMLDLLEAHLGTRAEPSMPRGALVALSEAHGVEVRPEWGTGKLVFELYDQLLLPATRGPVLMVGYPVEVSPLARRSRSDGTMADRFELVVGGRELANGYSELTDPDEQAERFGHEAAAAAAGDLEAHPADLAFVRALEYGLPPTAGIGIGIDRLVMVLAEVAAIRDVILFPTLRPETGP
jgi:lysyl-tRNA synthetase class 2